MPNEQRATRLVMPMEDAMKARCLVVGMMLTASAVAGAKEPLSIHVSFAVANAPANLVIRTKVEPNAENRLIEVIADSTEFYRSSTIMLEGDRAPRSARFEFRNLPAGEYDVTAVVIGMDGRHRSVARARVNVLGPGLARFSMSGK
jgi:hypothetical protein